MYLIVFSAEEEEKYPFKYPIHWRRAEEFMKADASKGLRPAEVFYEDIEPNDIKQGSLGNCWFMCALGSLAERPKLVENLFIVKKKSKEGIYRIKFCKNGEWVEVTIDDYFPCLPFSGPLFSRAHDNEMWVLLIEKAYAKLHGNYFTLRGGFANEGMIDLTGCPSTTYDFTNAKVKIMIDNGQLFKEMMHFDNDGYLLSASTPGEDRWTELGGPDK
jgi:calpain-15